MRIAINAQLIRTGESYRSAGVSNYSLELLRALGQLRLDGKHSHELVGYVSQPGLRIDGVEVVQTWLPRTQTEMRIVWEQTMFPAAVAARRADLVHGLVNVLPLVSATPGVVTVHDLAFLRMPELLPANKRAYLSAICRASVSRARRVIAVSRQTADELTEFFGTSSEKVVVVPNGVGASFAPIDEGAQRAFRALKRLPDRYLLFVGTLEPRKNLPLLVRAYARWRKQTDDANLDVKLVLAGGRGWYYDELFGSVREAGVEDAVILPGFVASDELPAWYGSALAFVFPSWTEGFGLPVLEAMACGTPVLCSATASPQEVTRGAALTFDRGDADALVHALHLMVGQAALRAELAQRGLERAAEFSWRRSALETLAVYEEAVESQ
jgi:glycosyltransferase involved in cell wall biosynthesis